MRFVLNIDRVFLILLGGLWILQGAGFAPGGVMFGRVQWAVTGGAMLLVELGLLYASLRRMRA